MMEEKSYKIKNSGSVGWSMFHPRWQDPSSKASHFIFFGLGGDLAEVGTPHQAGGVKNGVPTRATSFELIDVVFEGLGRVTDDVLPFPILDQGQGLQRGHNVFGFDVGEIDQVFDLEIAPVMFEHIPCTLR
eukprot:TRINITY_DN3058_c0_g3_i4.p1 TRINITY_DN3058_c0_g3~~TRINITY_DN3058_c0_g3_i4.p1  ORF type:complete len:131 (-),score=6.27 TRINITY_DN3058_c0_g3_i4:19-411(-)